MAIIGYAVTMLVGITLGLIGGGGSIFTIPVLVYLFAVPAVEATSYSHFLVGVTAALASVNYFKSKKIHFSSVLYFGIPSVLSVYFSRVILMPWIPEKFSLGSIEISKDLSILLLFSIMMIGASYSMISKCEKCTKDDDDSQIKLNIPLVILAGFSVGILTGLVGAGGGFLIIPSLVFFGRLPMKKAIATSLFIIACKSLIGFGSEIGVMTFNWNLLLSTTALSVLGMFIGTYLNKFIKGENLKPAFGWLVLVMGIFMLVLEIKSL